MSKPIWGAAYLVAFVSSLGGMPVVADDHAVDGEIDGEVVEAPELSQALEEEAVADERRTPTSVSSFNFDDLEVRGIHGLGDMVAGNMAGLLIQPSSFNGSSLSLAARGISGTTPHLATGEAGVGVFVDGSYVARTQGLSLDLLDIDSVEVVRGSQAVLGGRNTSGGAVYLTSNKPTGQLGFEQFIKFGEIGDEVASVSHLNLPQFADMLSAKISYMTHNHDGWVDSPSGAVVNDANNYWVRDNEGLRFAIRLDEGGSFVLDYSYLSADVTSTQPYFQVLSGTPPSGFSLEPEFQDTARSAVALPESKVDIDHHNQTVTLEGERATVTANVSFRDVESREFTNADGIFGTGFADSGETANRLDQEQFSQKLQIDTQVFDGALNLTLGLSNFSEQVDLSKGNQATVGSRFEGSTDIDSFALFAQGVFVLSDNAELSLGWRETSDEKKINSDVFADTVTGVETTVEDDNTDYKIALTLDLSDSMRSYLSYASGYKSAGASLFSPTLNPAGSVLFSPYEAETTETIEVGLSGVFSEVFSFSVVAFSTDIDDRQIEVRSPTDVSVIEVVGAPETATIEGVELDMSLSIAEIFTITGLYTYLDTEAATIDDPFAPGNSLTANVAQAPEHMGSVALDLRLGEVEAGLVKLHVDYTGVSSYFYDPINLEEGSRDIFNARVSLSGLQLEDDSGEIEIGLWVQNLTDSDYVLASELVDRNGSPFTVGAFGEPRSYGIDIRYQR